jgi:hypothetical protein
VKEVGLVVVVAVVERLLLRDLVMAVLRLLREGEG